MVLTGIISARVELDYARLVPLVPEDRPHADDLSEDLARIFSGFGEGGPYWLTLADLEATDWERPIYSMDGTSQPLIDYAGMAWSAMSGMRELAAGRRPTDVRLVFWLDS